MKVTYFALILASCFGYLLANSQLRADSDACYFFTWVNSKRTYAVGNNDTTNPCGQSTDTGIPCAGRVISASEYPVPPTKEQIATELSKETCDRALGGACLKYTLTGKDEDGTPIYISRFCGKAVDGEDGPLIDSGCHKQDVLPSIPGAKAELCICAGNKCNSAYKVTFLNYKTIFLMAILATISFLL